MTGFEYVAEAIELFEADLASGGEARLIRTVASLAGKIGYSVHHFTRLFTAVAGIPPKDYMQGRTLSTVAERIVRTDLPLATLAREAGFADYETFSRAFRSRFGMPPKRLRDLHYIPFECTARLEPRMIPADLSLRSREPDTVREEALHLCGMAFYMDGSEKSFHRQWAAFMSVQGEIRNRKFPERYYQYSSWSPSDVLPGISILCALETESSAEQGPLFVCRSLPASTYLRFVHTGDIRSLAETYRYIYGEYMASHAVKPVDCWEFQRYGRDDDTVEIHIPVTVEE